MGETYDMVKALDGVDLSVEEGSLLLLWENPAVGNLLFCICLVGLIH